MFRARDKKYERLDTWQVDDGFLGMYTCTYMPPRQIHRV